MFSKRATPPPPSILPASELKPDADLVGAALSRDGPGSEEVVSLAGAKSGLRISFATNRAYLRPPQPPLSSCAHIATAIAD